MAEWQGYLRFEDRSYFGESKYRSSEGWIDLEGEIVSKPGEFTVRCPPGRVLPLLFIALQDGKWFRSAVVEQRSSGFYKRYTMSQAFISACLWKRPTCQLALGYKEVKRTIGIGP